MSKLQIAPFTNQHNQAAIQLGKTSSGRDELPIAMILLASSGMNGHFSYDSKANQLWVPAHLWEEAHRIISEWRRRPVYDGLEIIERRR